MKDPLFFLAILPPADIQAEVTAFKQLIADRWGPRHAFKSPPHLTLQPPFAWAREELPRLKESLAEFAAGQRAFPIELKDFAAFAPRVVYVRPLPNRALEQLFHELVAHLARTLAFHDPRNDRGFHPHLTIAHRDVPADRFAEIWAHFHGQTYERTFEANAITLLKQGQGMWEREAEFLFAVDSLIC